MTIDYVARYSKAKEKFHHLLKHAIALSIETSNRPVTSYRQEDACLIFTKIVGHAMSIARLLPTGQLSTIAGKTEIWDLSSLCALVRALIDSYYALAYIAGEEISDEEREFRRLIWNLHGKCRRHHLLKLVRSVRPKAGKIEKQINQLKGEVQSHPFFSTLPKKVASETARGERAYHLTHSELNKRLRVHHEYYQSAYVFLSSYVHTYPFSLSQLAEFRAGDDKSILLMTVAVDHCSGFLSLSLDSFDRLIADKKPTMPLEVREIIDEWMFIISNNVSRPQLQAN